MIVELALLALLIKAFRRLMSETEPAIAEITTTLAAGWPVDVSIIYRIQVTWSVTWAEVQQQTAASATLPTLSDQHRDALTRSLDELTAAVRQALETPGSGDVKARKVLDAVTAFDRRWAQTTIPAIATAEATRHAAEQELATPAAARPGAWKIWVTRGDDRVRATHRHVGGPDNAIPVAAAWTVGGAPMRFPADPLGPLREIAGCRCRIKIVEGKPR